jgi:peptide/nickel transport system substrate-binding protein
VAAQQVARVLAVAAIVAGARATRVGAETRPTYGGDVIGSLLGEPATLDPPAARSHAEISLVGMIYDTLYRTQADGSVVPQLALAMPEVAGPQATIRVREVAVHDGTRLGAADVAASLERLRSAPAAWLLAGITKVEAQGDAVVLTLAFAPVDGGAQLAARLAQPQTAITPNNRPGTEHKAVGTGPFELVQVDRKARRVVLRAFEPYFAGRPYVDRLELAWFVDATAEVRRFETGLAHVSLRGAVTFTGAGHQPKFKHGEVDSPDSLLVYVGFGRAHRAIGANRDLRRALSLALPRDAFAHLGSGELVSPASTPIPVPLGGGGATPEARAGDPTAALVAFRAAQAAVRELAPPRLAGLELEILVDASRPDENDVAARVLGALDGLGVRSRITPVDARTLADRVARGACDLYVDHLPAATADHGLLWVAAFERGGDAWGRTQLAKGAVDAAVAAKELAARLPILPLYHRAIRVTHRKDVRNLTPDLAGRVGFVDAAFFGEPERGTP